MSEEYLYEPERCPLTAALRVIGGKWRGLIWWRLSKGLVRFNALRRSLPQISTKVLVEELRQLEVHGIVTRREHDEVPPRVEYELTEYGAGLEPIFEALGAWGERHLARTGAREDPGAGTG